MSYTDETSRYATLVADLRREIDTLSGALKVLAKLRLMEHAEAGLFRLAAAMQWIGLAAKIWRDGWNEWPTMPR